MWLVIGQEHMYVYSAIPVNYTKALNLYYAQPDKMKDRQHTFA